MGQGFTTFTIPEEGITPAALSAYAKGDMENFLVASTPGGILAQEKAGQTALVASTNMPKELYPDRESFERLGFTFGEDVDDIFMKATLPSGWKREATEHSMHSDILDEQGRRRVGVFYKAAFYDRRADASLISRFKIEDKYPDTMEPMKDDDMVYVIIKDGEQQIYLMGGTPLKDWQGRQQLREEAKKWLDANRPGWRDPVESWNI